MKIVIGLVVEKGSGKETFSKFLKEIANGKETLHIRFSDLLKETLEAWSIPVTRHNLQHLVVVMDKGFGVGTLSHAVEKRIENLKADMVILDGVRWKTDVDLLKRFPQNVLVYITSTLHVRYDRLKARGEKTGEESTSFVQFMKEEKAKNELLIPKIGASADVKIENSGSLKEFREKVEEFYTASLFDLKKK